MKKHKFISERQERWRRLERILYNLERQGAKKLEEHELDEFVHLYQITCSDLARARARSFGEDVEGFLNTLVARGYEQFHPPKQPELRAIGIFFAADFPRAVRSLGFYLLNATVLFVVPIVLAAIAVTDNPARAYALTPAEQLDALTEAYATGHQSGRSESQDTAMTGYYINNNIGIAFRCFATGIFFGLGSIFFLVVNGVLGGAIGAFICSAGYYESFLSFVVGHGAFELTAIVLSGATGLKLGLMLVNPGRLNRLDRLRRDGPTLVRIVLGSAAMLLVAALVEGFWSPSGATPIVKFIVGALLWVLVIAYLALAGRWRKEPSLSTLVTPEQNR